MSDSVKHKIASFVLFNVLWLSAVAGREQYIWLTLALVVAQVGYSLWVAKIKLRLILQLLAVGLLLEAIATGLGTIDFTGGLFPLWLALLWIGFAAMAPVALDWLTEKPTIAALAGAISGPFSYWVGIGLGAGESGSVLQLVVTYAIVWALFMLFFCRAFKARQDERLIL
ncbi:DUF2878 domain-containing protein [Idiomarina sp. OT37-5b]|jgi:hypothetical protein|uniref:DUF2878 domain-containing protein n=1 Tax=Idiomarina aquatica TaxID=1327752 RepID=A0AA94EEJ3_9GAMM|nr:MULTISPECIES: DUF2878 domain-containing protein [Idiomarina]AVJ56017.1 DUF2878 domain-containing protein [Idiomarina sp. OT37-5b]RUO43453.1 DUF2878 domain-containing protein [Idiomarina aquatica]